MARTGKKLKKREIQNWAENQQTPLVDQKTFLAKVEKIAPTHVKGYVCLF